MHYTSVTMVESSLLSY